MATQKRLELPRGTAADAASAAKSGRPAEGPGLSERIQSLAHNAEMWLHAYRWEQRNCAPEPAETFAERLAAHQEGRATVGAHVRQAAIALVPLIDETGLDALPVRELASRCNYLGGPEGHALWWPPLRARLDEVAARASHAEPGTSIRTRGRARCVQLLKPQHRSVLNFLAETLGDGEDRPTMDLIVDKCKLGKQTVVEAVRELKRLGYIEVLSSGTWVIHDPPITPKLR